MTLATGVLHMVDKVLLPFDGDGELSPVQKARLAGAKKALDARYPDRVVVDHDNDDGAYTADGRGLSLAHNRPFL